MTTHRPGRWTTETARKARGPYSMRPCARCGTPALMDAQQRYCGGACRVAAFRARRIAQRQ